MNPTNLQDLQLKNLSNHVIYSAGLPHFLSNFSRDSLISGILMADAIFLKDQLLFSTEHQGTKNDAFTAEEVGKIHHEFPGVNLNGFSTEYAACDTTGLFLLAHEVYLNLSGDKEFIQNQQKALQAGVKYIVSHLKDGVFWETPSFSGASKFALSVTYWKDSKLPQRKDGEPVYPVAYLLAHAQNLAGLRSAAKLLNDSTLMETVNEMVSKLQTFFYTEPNFNLAIDGQGRITGISSDVLQMLVYLEPSDLTEKMLETVRTNAKTLSTTIGFRTLSENLSEAFSDQYYDVQGYHSKTVWPFEQALIHLGASKFNLLDIALTARKVYECLDSEPEILEPGNNNDYTNYKNGGCDPQLWTIAAKNYFSKNL